MLCVLAFTAASHAFLKPFQETLTFFLAFFGGLHCTAYRVLVAQPEIESGPSAVKVPKPNHWTARELPPFVCLFVFKLNLKKSSPGIFKFFKKWFMICLHPVKHCSRGITFKN